MYLRCNQKSIGESAPVPCGPTLRPSHAEVHVADLKLILGISFLLPYGLMGQG